MKLHKIIASVLAVAVIVTAVPTESFMTANAAGETTTGTVKAGDTNFVRRNRYKDNGDTLGGIKAGDLRWDRGSLYEYKKGLTTPITNSDGDGYETNQYRWPYAALKVSVTQEGLYNLSVVISTPNNTSYSTIGMVVNGVMNVLSFTKNRQDTINTKALLKEGENIIVFTSPMPASISDRATGASDSNVYPWNDFTSFTFANGVTVQEAPTGAEVVASINGVTRVEAENTAYTIWNGYNKTEEQAGASGTDSNNNVVGGASNGKCTQTSAQLASYLDDKQTAYVQYQVEAPKDGTYSIRLGAFVGTDKHLAHDRTTVVVNETVYEAKFNAFSKLDTATLNVNLKKGYNIIRCFAPIANEESAGWLNQDFLELDSRLTAVTQSQTTINAGDETKVLANQYTDKGNTLEGAVQGLIQTDKPSVETLKYAKEKIANWPWAAMKVTAPKEGYYDIAVNLGTKDSATSTQIAMLVDGKAVAQPYTKAGSAVVDCSVFLTAGEHVLAFTLPMPKTSAEAASNDVWNTYPWCNYNSFVIDSKLVIGNVPTISDVTDSLTVSVAAGDEAKVLGNKYTDKGSTLEDASRGNLNNDQPTIDMLANAGAVIDNWPFAALKLTAESNGEYEVLVDLGPNKDVANQKIAVIVDGKAQCVPIQSASATTAKVKLNLSQGTHIVVFTSPMPESESELAEKLETMQVWTVYTWLNFKTFYLDYGLRAETKPTMDEIKECFTYIHAGDEDKVLANRFTDKGDYLASPSADHLKNNRVSLETLKSFDVTKIPYAAFEVTAEAEKDYHVYFSVTVNAATSSKQVGLLVDGTTLDTIPLDATGVKQLLKAKVHLTGGKHILMLTTPMPADKASADAITNPEDDGWSAMNAAYPWFDVNAISVDEGLTVTDNLKQFYSDGIEAENTSYVVTSTAYEVKKLPKASGNEVLGGDNTIHKASEFASIGKKFDWNKKEYVQFTVEVPSGKAGTHTFSLGVMARGTSEIIASSAEKPYVIAVVNGKAYEAEHFTAWNTYEELSLELTLKEGTNVIRCFAVAENPQEGTRLVYDYFESHTDASFMVVERAEEDWNVINAGDESRVLISEHYTDNGDTVGNGSYGDMQWDKLFIDGLNVDQLSTVPYVAMKVTVPKDGYYDIRVEGKTNTQTESTHIALLVDGTNVYSLGFKVEKEITVGTSIYLTEGTHTLVFTSPMPLDEKTASATGEFDKKAYPWFDFHTISFLKNVTVEKVPSKVEIENPFYDRIEAEDNKYVYYAGYTSEAEKSAKASGGAVRGGTKRWLIEQTFDELKTWIDGSDSHMPYVEYTVVAPANGKYDIRVGFIADVNKSVATRNEIKKPFVSVLVNKDIYKAQYTADWGETEAVKLSVDLKKGRNIIRCTTYTADQEIFTVSSWINQDFLDLDKRLTAIEKSTTKVEAEASEFYHLVKIQDGDENEKASNGKMLGSAQVLRAKSIGLTLENFTADQIRMVPYFSYTVNAPMDGYYSVSMNFCGDGRLAKNQIGMLVDDEVSTVKYNRTGKTSEKNRAIMMVYLTKGEHNLTFTSPLPMNAAELKDTDWSQRWMNFDYITLHDGLKLATKQKSPTDIEDLVRIEAEDVGLPNMTKVNAAAEGKEAKEGYVGGAKYRRSQSVAAIKADGIDPRRTPFVQYTVNAKSAGTYTAYFQASYGIYNPMVEKMTGSVAIEVNGKVTFHEVELVKNKTNNILIPVKMDLSAGNNIVRLTHLTADSIKGEGYGWIDFNYIEVSASDNKKITFVPTNGVVEAERSEAVTYVENTSSGSSGGACLGKGDYNYIDEKDVTFENLDVKKLGELSRVTYTVVAEQAGTYNIAIQFNGGVLHYTFDELVERDTIGFAVSVNEGEKQLVEFSPDVATGSISRIVEVELKEGENKIMVTATLADYIIGASPRIEDEYRLYWIDHDAIRLTAGVSATEQNVEPYDINDTDVDHKQLSAKASNDAEDGFKITTPMIIGEMSLTLLLAIFFIILFLKKKKKEEEGAQ